MNKRRAARALVLLALYQLEVGHVTVREALETVFSPTADEALSDFFGTQKKGKAVPQASEVREDAALRAYVERTVEGTWQRREALDDLIRQRTTHWRPERMARTDLNILRMAAYELTEQTEIPAAVTVNEAVELAKAFGEDDSGRFVNGVLGAMIAQGTAETTEIEVEHHGNRET